MHGNRESRQPIGQEDAVENNVIDKVRPVPPIHLIRLLHAPPLNAQDEDVNEIKVARTSKKLNKMMFSKFLLVNK